MSKHNKIFVKKSRKGNVIKVVREIYLRDDIVCGSELCSTCQQLTFSLSSSCKNYLILDTNVLLHQLDVIENPKITNVIILQTVLEEVKNRNMHFYTRLRELISNPTKHFFVFSNEYHL